MNTSIYQATRYLEDLAQSVRQNTPMVKPLTASFARYIMDIHNKIQTVRYMRDLARSRLENRVLIQPLRATFAITFRCNSRCNYCGIWKAPKYTVPIDDCRHVLDELKAVGVRAVTLTGGEPFLHGNLPEIIAFAVELGLLVSVTTNGLLLNSKRLIASLEAGLHVLTFSLDSIDPDIYFRIRGVPLRPVLKNMERILRIKDKFPSLSVSVNCMISKLNIDKVVDVVEYCTDRGISVGFQPVHFTYTPIRGPETPYEQITLFSDYETRSFLMCTSEDLTRLTSLIDNLIDMKYRGYLINSDIEYLKGFPKFMTSGQLPDGFSCYAGFTTVSVDHLLYVRSCWPMEPPVGNLKQQSLKEILDSEKHRSNLTQMLNLNCPKCWLRCHTEWSKEWFEGFLNWIALKTEQP